jgi:hypothetical protein
MGQVKHPLTLQMQPRRLMAFIDGENLVRRFEDMKSQGWIPRDDLVHEPGVLIWHSSFFSQATLGHAIVLRTTYYTSKVGSPEDLDALRDRILKLDVPTFPQVEGPWPNRLTPVVFKRDKGTQRSKGVDIALAVDVLNHVSRNNVDTVMLFGGDGDYLPLVHEVLRAGKIVLLSAFSSGLSPELVRIVSDTYRLEATAFAKAPPPAA